MSKMIQRKILEHDIRRASNALVESMNNAQLGPKDQSARDYLKVALENLSLAQINLKVG